MSYAVILEADAVEDLVKLPSSLQSRIRHEIAASPDSPFAPRLGRRPLCIRRGSSLRADFFMRV